MLNYTEKPQKHLYPKSNGFGDNGHLLVRMIFLCKFHSVYVSNELL